MGAKKRTRGMERLEGNGNWVKKWLQPEGRGEFGTELAVLIWKSKANENETFINSGDNRIV